MRDSHSRCVIVGNGVAGATAALAIRAREPHPEITLIGGESDYFFSRTALMCAFMDRLSRRELEPLERSVWKRERITLRRGWVRDLDARRQRVTLDSGESLSYSRLLLATGSEPVRPAWDGLDRVRGGAAHFVSLQDLDACERLARSARDAVVVGGGLIGVELAECLVWAGLRVTFLIREPWYWSAALDEREAAMVAAHLRARGVDVRTGEEVAAVECDSSGCVRAIATTSGAALPCAFLGIAIGVRPAIGWLRGVSTPPELSQGVRTDSGFRTSLDNVWAAGDCAEILLPDGSALVEQNWYSARRQAELAARSICGEPVVYRPPVPFNSAKFFGIEYTSAGQTANLPPGARQFYARIPRREASIRVVDHDGAVCGFSMLGSRWDHRLLVRWIEERRPLEWVAAHLREAQFDGEFGRAPLPALERVA
jgi:NADPH-dependent 2,4-dienoyl-CoA reductase/sulfur reductase-like enzyme